MTSSADLLATLGVVVASLTVVITVVIARYGWERDRKHRDATLEAECVTALCNLIQSRYAPLAGKAWDAFDGTVANAHHISAIAAMNAVSESRRDHDLVKSVAGQAFVLQQESIRYRNSADHRVDAESRLVGDRRAAIHAAAAMMQEDLLLWQRDGTKSHIRSFWFHYSNYLLDPARLA